MFEFIEVSYNRQRRHSTLGMRTPAEFEPEQEEARLIKMEDEPT